MRLFLFLLVVLVAGIVAGNLYLTDQPQTARYRTEPAANVSIVESVAVTGYAEPMEVRVVESEIPGTVAEVFKDYNDAVEEGEPLVRLSSDLQRVQLMKANYELDAARETAKLADAAYDAALATRREAEAGLNAARRELKYMQELFAAKPTSVVPKTRVDIQEDLVKKAEVTLEKTGSLIKQADIGKAEARAKLKAAETAVEVVQQNLDKTVLKSNMTGFVLKKDLRVGDQVGRPKVSLTGEPSALFILASPLDKMRAIVKVSEADYSRVHKGQKVTFRIDAYEDTQFDAAVTQVRNTPTADRLAVSYETVIEFDNRKDPQTGEWMIKPQATVSADVEIGRAENVLAVPNAAVQFAPAKFDIETPPKVEKGQRVLWVLNQDGRAAPRVVRIGISDGNWTQITEGDIQAGDEVIVEEQTEKKTQFRLPFGG